MKFAPGLADLVRIETNQNQQQKGENTMTKEQLAEKLDSLKQALREPIAELFGVHPDDLNP